MVNQYPDVLTVDQAADFLQITKLDFEYVLKTEQIPVVILSGQIRILKLSLIDWFKQKSKAYTSQSLHIENADLPIESESAINLVSSSLQNSDSKNESIDTDILLGDITEPDITLPDTLNGVVTAWYENYSNGRITTLDDITYNVKSIDVDEDWQTLKVGNLVAFFIDEESNYSAGFKNAKRVRVRQEAELTSKDRSSMLYKTANLLKDKDVATAGKLMYQALSFSPLEEMYLEYADLVKSYRSDWAVNSLHRGAQTFPNSGAIYYELAKLYWDDQRFDDATKYLQLGLEKTIGVSHDLHWLLTQIHIEQHDFEEARFHFNKALELKPEFINDASYKRVSFDLGLIPPGNGIESRAAQIREFFKAANFDVKTNEVSEGEADLIISANTDDYSDSFDIRGDILVRCLTRKAKQKDIDNVLNAVRKSSDINQNRELIFLAAENLATLENALLRNAEDGREVIIPLDYPDVENAMKSGPQNLLQKLLDQWLTKRDLFHVKTHVSGRRFFGRESEIRLLTRSIDDGHHVGVYGLRRAGKTSLLHQLKQARPKDIIIFCSAEEATSLSHCAYMYWLISRKLYEVLVEKADELGIAANNLRLELGTKSSYASLNQAKEKNAMRFDSDMARVLDLLTPTNGVSAKIVVMIDEIEWMLPSQSNPQGFEGHALFFQRLRSLGQSTNGRVVSIIAGANPLISERPKLEGFDNPVFQFHQEMFLPLFPKSECNQMLTQLGHYMNVEFKEEGLDLIYKETGGHPYIARQFCSHIWNSLRDESRNRTGKLCFSQQLIEEHIESFIRDKGSILGEIVERLESHFPEELELLKFISEGVSTVSELSSLLPSGRTVDDALRHLQGYQLINFVGDRYSVKINLLDRWLKR